MDLAELLYMYKYIYWRKPAEKAHTGAARMTTWNFSPMNSVADRWVLSRPVAKHLLVTLTAS
jgi:hypothetical protein